MLFFVTRHRQHQQERVLTWHRKTDFYPPLGQRRMQMFPSSVIVQPLRLSASTRGIPSEASLDQTYYGHIAQTCIFPTKDFSGCL